ncbi:MAG TPA: hypothetical protein VIV63_06085 [Steroidobacteraceae bacterium]
MHVPSYPRVAALLLMLASFAGGAHAVEFDEKIRAPMVREPATLRTQALSYAEKFKALHAASPQDVIRNRALTAERFDITWQIQQAIDTGRPLGDLSAIGLEKKENGSYEIDFNANPEWDRPDFAFLTVLKHENQQAIDLVLTSRGFREADLATLKQYVSTHDLDQTVRSESLPLTLGFSKIVKKYDKLKRPVDDAAVLSYIYQREKLAAENGRRWAEGVLNVLDAQRARILLSFMGEMSIKGIWAPSDQRAGIDEQLRLMRLPNFEQLVVAEAAGVTP